MTTPRQRKAEQAVLDHIRECVTIVLEIPTPVLSTTRAAGSIGGRMK